MTLLVCLLFFLSGASALLFETLWFHQAGLVFGNGVWASSLVLSSFMAGLALGNGLAARFAHRLAVPLLAFALLETAVGLAGTALVHGLPALTTWLGPILGQLVDRPWALNPVRFVLAFGALLLPGAAMGATLPILVKALARRDRNFGRVLGQLYGWNTIGAVLGALSGELVLIEAFGIRGAAWCAASANAVAAASAFVLAQIPGASDAAPTPAAPAARLPGSARRILAAAFLCGGVLLALEVVWFRFLMLFVPGSSLAFAVMLAVVLSGIAAGGLVASLWLGRDPAAYRWTAPLALISGITSVLVYATFAARLERSGSDVVALACHLMAPVCVLSGLLFTLLGAALNAQGLSEARTTGLLALANTTGSALGSLAAVFLLLPLLGMERSFFALALLYAAVAWLVPAPSGPRLRAIWVARVACAGLAASLLLFPFGAMRDFLAVPVEHYGSSLSEVVAVREGIGETILFTESRRFGEPYAVRLITNSYSMSSNSYGARRYMKLFVYWPIAVHPAPRNALLISYGLGQTAQALTDSDQLERIDVVDISREILEMSDVAFPDPDRHPLRDPRVVVHVEDGRFFLQTTQRRFDLITGEPPPPKIAGVVSLYTREYFDLVHDRLAEGGIATYWLPIHSLDPGDARAITAAFCFVFADCSLWNGGSHNWMLAGTRDARGPVSEAHFNRQWHDSRVAPELEAVGLELPEQLGALFLADGPDLVEWIGRAPPLEDDHPRRLTTRMRGDERPAAVRAYEAWMDSRGARARFERSELVARLWPPALRERTRAWFEFGDLVESALTVVFEGSERLPEVQRVLSATPLRTLPLWLLGSDVDEQSIAARVAAAGRDGSELQHRLGIGALVDRDYERAIRHLRSAADASPSDSTAARQLRVALCAAGRCEDAPAEAARRPR